MMVHTAKFEDMALAAEIMVTSFRSAFRDFVSPETMDACTKPDNCRKMREAERIHGSAGWELDTILQEAGNCYLYEKMGYRRSAKRQVINDKMTIVGYEKE